MVGTALGLSLVLLFLSVPVFLVFGLGSGLVAIFGLNLPWSTLIQVSFGAVTKHVLLAIPLFIFAGLIMLRAGVARRLVALAMAMVGHWPGGLGVAMVLTMGFFAAFCGSILAAITAVGSIMLPEMKKSGYPPAFSVVLAASAGLLEALIPPSNAAIIFSSLTNVPVSQTFSAGILPGLVLMVLLIVVVMIRGRAFSRNERAGWGARLVAVRRAVPSLLTPVIILGGIYAGLLTPSESAAVAVVWAAFVGFFIHRELTFEGVWSALKATAVTTTVIFSIIAMATFLAVVLTYTQAPQHLTAYLLQYGIGPITFLIMVGVICLVLGTFIEIVPVFYLTVPIFMGIALTMDVSMLHLYVVFTAFAGIGLLTPPVCVGIYTAASVANISADKAFPQVPLFVGVGVIYGVLMIFTPWLAEWLPSALH
ncbi:TRAP transporter large permease [Oceanibacterium hippocampi]|uniref:TRAP transporter large permease protein n=1 Tax=Oceanibacterium hippocampi TaxID=745714 RepID=A0A1Y5ST84_9PROT|nr:TRAP transporter large permease [Oceanibacterium hippocampi]SLN47549.1 Sialic acid TRAP transporter permease protein SiaT [Oceanibacterium hippocampi]